MKIEATNFGSYKELSFDFSNLGLALVYGETGSGKSTLQDLVSWALYGLTAKGGSVDEVRNWDRSEEPTTVTLTYGDIVITRIRGKPAQNDLYWVENGSVEKRRGKDVSETQRLLDDRVGVSSDVFFTGCYFNEFSSTSRFFMDTAKNRRALFERIADLSFPQNLSAKLLESRKGSKVKLKKLELTLASEEGSLKKITQSIEQFKKSSSLWQLEHENSINELRVRVDNFDKEKQSRIDELRTKYDRFESDRDAKLYKFIERIQALLEKLPEDKSGDLVTTKQKLSQLEDTKEQCAVCGGDAHSSKKHELLKEINKIEKHQALREQQLALFDKLEGEHDQAKTSLNPYKHRLESAHHELNIYVEAFKEETTRENPFKKMLENAEESLVQLKVTIASLKEEMTSLTKEINSVTALNDLTSTLRGALLEHAIKEVENEANRILESYFDAIFRLVFQINGDDLDVTILKDARECSYTQLSKGQRQLLKLSYSIAIMKKTATECGIKLPLLMFDEALDGLDSALKIKAYSLFSELEREYSSVVLIDHSPELQQLFYRKFYITIVHGASEVQEVE